MSHEVFFFLTDEDQERTFKTITRIGQQSHSFILHVYSDQKGFLTEQNWNYNFRTGFRIELSAMKESEAIKKKSMIKNNLNIKYSFQIVQTFYVSAFIFLLLPPSCS